MTTTVTSTKEERRGRRVVPPIGLFGRIKAAEPVRIVDISVSGTRLETEGPLCPHSRFSFALVTGMGELKTEVVVRRCRAAVAADGSLVYHAGVEFEELAGEQLEIVEQLIALFGLSEMEGPAPEESTVVPLAVTPAGHGDHREEPLRLAG